MPRIPSRSAPPPVESLTPASRKTPEPECELIPSSEVIARLALLKQQGVKVYSMTVKRKGCAVNYVLAT